MQKSLFFIGLLASFGLACSNRSDDCEKNASCGNYPGSGGTGGTSGQGGTGGAGGDGGGCDTSKTPSEEACLVTDEFGIFVDGTVATSGSGTKTSPVKTIAEGLALAQTSAKNVLVCNTTYDEKVNVSFGAKIFGGFTCGEWSYQTGSRATVTPSERGFALRVSAVSDLVLVEDIEFQSQPGVDPSESSVAAFVTNSTNVALTRVKLVAGAGVTGSNGTLTAVQFPAPATLAGNSTTTDTGALAKTGCTCPAGGTTVGGAGGAGGSSATGGGSGQPAGTGGKGGTNSGAACTSGGNGDPGLGNQDGLAPTVFGTIDDSGWLGSPGGTGQPGQPGQGGGGGGGSTDGGGGGGGACGGCGGAGALGGGAGGASIGLLSLGSTVSVIASTIETAAGGAGGLGSVGQPGQSPGGAKGDGAGFGCEGGNGGPGGAGGASAGGAGGVSVGIVYKGTVPTTDGVSYALGQLGVKGLGGKPGVNDGIDGVSEETLAVP